MNIDTVRKSFLDYFRPRRLQQFKNLFPMISQDISVLDVGGAVYQWDYLKSPARITILNIDIDQVDADSKKKYTFVQGDGRSLKYSDRSFDLVFSNSVIEHVGNFSDQRRFATEIRRVGKQFYCQTPNRWFFVEPHLVALFIHWFPLGVQRKLVRWFSIWGWMMKADQKQVDLTLSRIRLLTYSELKELFPDCEIIREKFLGLTKSFIVIFRG